MQGATMKIHITLTTGKTITLYVEASNTVEHVKTIVHHVVGIPRHKQRLIFADNELDDSHTLTSCNIEHGTILKKHFCFKF